MNPNYDETSIKEPVLSSFEDDWSYFEDPGIDETYKSALSFSDLRPPPQLHPAVSLGMQKASSCYFSIASSHESLADLMSKIGDDSNSVIQGDLLDYEIEYTDNRSLQMESSDIFYHDILMNVFTFLDAQSLASFSETARRPNFEVFYFLQLQLQRALLVDGQENDHTTLHHQDHLTVIAGISFLTRLATMDPEKAQSTVNEYLESNSTLRTMPLSHSIAYMRHFLTKRGFHNKFSLESHPSPSQALASAAVLASFVGAAYMSGEIPEIPVELPNMLFRFGFVGSLMGAARHKMSDAEATKPEEQSAKFRLPSLFEMKETLTATLSYQQKQQRDSRTILSDPYDHIQIKEDEEEKQQISSSDEPSSSLRKMPTGCVGAYSRAIQNATNSIAIVVKESRKRRFMALSEEERRENVAAFLDACSSDDHLPLVKEMIHQMYVDSFHVGSDGETCALHTAAFHGASKVLDFLLQGIDDTETSRDGGLCDVNCRDGNGWTALHFAAGANSVKAVEVLARHGADFSIEANNGYSPLQWAMRLSNEEVSETLRDQINNETNRTMGWISSQPLSTIANRFFSLIPTQQ